ncbi:MAG: sodium/proton-translocating pyrophosphatase, partial [Bacteroidota bacterium]
IFSALCIQAVGKAAMDMVQEVRRQFREIPGIMEYKAKPEYEKCVAISTKASIREMMMPGAIALLTPILVGFGFKGMFDNASSAEMLGGLLAGVTVSGVLMGIFQSNAGGAWDNAKKSFEKGVVINGETFYKKSEPHKASVTGDTVGDPFKDTSGPSMNILIKLMSIVSLVIAPYISVNSIDDAAHNGGKMVTEEVLKCNINGQEYTCTNKSQCDSIMSVGKKDISELSGKYMVDGSHSSVNFTVKHIISNTSGSIKIDSGYVQLDNASGAKIYVAMNMNSIATQNEMRDDHLKNKEKFFNVKKFPAAIFEAAVVEKLEGEMNYSYIAKGKLTLKGVSKEVSLKFNYQGASDQEYDGKKFNVCGFEGEALINRNDFGIEGGGAAEEITIKISLEGNKPL